MLDAAKTKHYSNCDFVVTILYLYSTSCLPSEWHLTKIRRGEQQKVNITRKLLIFVKTTKFYRVVTRKPTINKIAKIR
jgi:hypothetical protein